jgi:hypothetical protein
MIANRMAAKGDTAQGMVVTDRAGITVWAGEFHATVGDGKVADFAAACDRSALGFAYLILADNTVAMFDLTAAIRRNY